MDLEGIVVKIAIGIIGGASAWVLGSIASLRRDNKKIRKDLDAAFIKLRRGEINAEHTD